MHTDTSRNESISHNTTMRNREKRESPRESLDPGNDAVMYIPISSSSACPTGSNSVADASVTGISQVIIYKYVYADSELPKISSLDLLL